MRRPVGRALPELVAAAALLVWSTFATWPLVLHPATRVAGDLGDPLENAWIFGWGAHAVLAQPRALFHANMFFPSRWSLAFAENMLGLSVPVAPVFWITHNAVLAANVATIAVVTLSAYGLYRLVHAVGGSRSAAIVAAAAFTVAPYRVASISHVHVVATHMLPFALLIVLRVAKAERASWWWTAALAAVVGAQLWGSLTGGVVTLGALGAACLWVVLVRRRTALRPLAVVVLGVAGGVVLAYPVIHAYREARAENVGYAHPDVEVVQNSATPGSYLLPARGGAVVRSLYEDLGRQFRPRYTAQEKPLFPGFVFGVGGVVAIGAWCVWLWRRDRARRSVAALAALVGTAGLVASFGPRWGGVDRGAPLPFLLIGNAVPGGLTRVPARFGVLVLFALAWIVGLALSNVPRPWRARVALVSLVLLAVEAWPATGTTPRVPPLTAAHRQLASTDRVVLALPTLEFTDEGGLLFPSVPREAAHLWYSTAHFRPMTNGYGAFLPEPYVEIAKAVQDFPSTSALAYLHGVGVDTVVVESQMLPGSRWQGFGDRLRAWPGITLIASDRGTEVYDITAAH